MTSIIINIAQLIGVREESSLLRGADLAVLPSIENGFVLIEDGIIADYGYMYELEIKVPNLPKILLMHRISLYCPAGAIVTPILCLPEQGKKNLLIN